MKTRLLRKLRKKYFKRYRIVKSSPTQYYLYRQSEFTDNWLYHRVKASSEKIALWYLKDCIDKDIVEWIQQKKAKSKERWLNIFYPF